MKFKVVKGSVLFEKMSALWDKIIKCDAEAANLAKELGFNQYCKGSFVLAGGLYGLIPKDGVKPEKYSWAFSDRQYNAVMPSRRYKINAEILDRIEKLPVVEYSEYNSLVGYDKDMSSRPASGSAVRFNPAPALQYCVDYFLINIPVHGDSVYEPVDGMIEILESEYNSLSKK